MKASDRAAQHALLRKEAKRIGSLLRKSQRKIVFCESCTGGLVSATLAEIPGISHLLCGSMVTYREETKSAWLGIPSSLIKKFDVVSEEVAVAMATMVLRKTPEAGIAASITGHLGPDAPKGKDGLAFVAVITRKPRKVEVRKVRLNVRRPDRSSVGKIPTRSSKSASRQLENVRLFRQLRASHQVLSMVRSVLNSRTKRGIN